MTNANSIPFALTDLTCTVYLDGAPFTVDRTTSTFKRLVEALNTPNVSPGAVRGILASYGAELQAMQEANKGRVEITRRSVLYDGRPVNDALTRRILDISSAGLPIDPWIAFVENLYSNPAEHAREELYLWLEGADLPITEDGHFLAYKKVSSDFKDLHTNTFDNSPGKIVTMPGGRPAVDPVRDNVCSTGLHFCSKSYLPSFGWGGGSKVVLVKINPADVVSIPSDYDNAKGRTWQYEVLSEVEEETIPGYQWAPVVADDGTEWYRKDPEGNLIKADPYEVEPYGWDDDEDEDWDDEEDEDVETYVDHRDREYVLGVYPESLLAVQPEAKVIYTDRIGDTIRLYTEDGGFDFDDEFEGR